jgi:hypothetical protein
VSGVDIVSVFGGLLKLAMVAGAALYFGLVLTNYRTERAPVRPQMKWRDPAHSAQRLAIWLGVKALALAIRMGTPIFGMLSEASADVGDWFLSHRGHESQ